MAARIPKSTKMNQKIWDRYSELYDYFTFSIQEELLSHIASRSRGDTFDIGCGVGKLFSYLLDNPDVRHITGIDSSDEMLRLAGKNYEDEIRKKRSNSSEKILQRCLK